LRNLAIAVIYLTLLAVFVRAASRHQPSVPIELKIVAGASLLHQGGGNDHPAAGG